MSTLQILTDDTYETHTFKRKIHLEGAQPLLIARNYSHGGKQMLPTFARAIWSFGEQIGVISVYGPVLKKDGTPGQQEAEMSYLTPHHPRWGKSSGYWEPPAPAWLLELFGIKEHTCTADTLCEDCYAYAAEDGEV